MGGHSGEPPRRNSLAALWGLGVQEVLEVLRPDASGAAALVGDGAVREVLEEIPTTLATDWVARAVRAQEGGRSWVRFFTRARRGFGSFIG